MKKASRALLGVLVGCAACGSAQARPAAPQWSVYEVALTMREVCANPYLQASVAATFRGPGGVVKTVAGFWAGGQAFRLRFTPTVQGRWSWVTNSTDPGLGGKTGELDCTAPAAGRHGFLRRDAARPYSFVYDDGARCFMWGQSYYDVILNVLGKGEWKRGVDRSAAHGMNKVRLHVFAHEHYRDDAGKVKEFTVHPQAIPFGGTYAEMDRDRLNLAYWEALDTYVEYLEAKGLLADLILFNPYEKNEMWGRQEQDERFVRYVLARYAAFPNVIWCPCNEWNYATRPKGYFDGIGSIVRREDPWMIEGGQLRPLSTHQGTHIGFDFFGSDWPTHAIVQFGVRNQRGVGTGEGTHAKDGERYLHGDEWGNASITYNLGRNLPVVNDEYGYLGEPTPITLDRQQHRWAIWGIATAGGYGSAGDFRTAPTGLPEISGDWAPAPDYGDIKRLVELFTTRGISYWNMRSQNHLVIAGPRVYALAETGRQYVFYTAVGGSFTVELAPGEYEAHRYDPRSGKEITLGMVRGGSHTFTVPEGKDWVVWVG